MARKFWLLKTEPSAFSVQMLAKCPAQTTAWDGVRNYQARNMLRDDVQVGDGVLFYHSRQPPMAVVGSGVVVRAGYPDASQFDPEDDHFDPAAEPRAPRWYAVDVRLAQIFARAVTRQMLKASPTLVGLKVLEAGCRLSVQPVSPPHWLAICRMGRG